MLLNLFDLIKNKAASIINRKKRSLTKIHKMGLESYIQSKIERYADSPALVAHFRNELHNLR